LYDALFPDDVKSVFHAIMNFSDWGAEGLHRLCFLYVMVNTTIKIV